MALPLLRVRLSRERTKWMTRTATAEVPWEMRCSRRHPTFDYSSPGGYFVTISVDRPRFPLLITPGPRIAGILAVVEAGNEQLTELGTVVQEEWLCLPSRYPHVRLDACIIMPDHLHGLLWLTDSSDGQSSGPGQGQLRHPAGTKPGSLPAVVQAFKSSSTFKARDITSRPGWPGRGRRIWQRNYDEQLIRSTDHLAAVRRYINRNPVVLLRIYDAQGRRRS